MKRDPSYEVATTFAHGHYQRAARFVCAGCGADKFYPLKGKTVPPDVAANWLSRDGWRSDAHSKTAIRCPACIAGRERHSLTSEPPSAKVIKMAEPAKSVPRELTQAERLRVRAILDKHFDDAAGCWLDGYSDQKAGEEAAVPWAHVTKIREAAYGPIRVDPEIAGLRAELTQIGRELAALAEKHTAAQKRLDALIAKRAA